MTWPVGGMLLALPATAPATLTLIENEDGNRAAVHDVDGAILGGLGMVSFAVVAAHGFGSAPAPLVLAAGLAAWSARRRPLHAAGQGAWPAPPQLARRGRPGRPPPRQPPLN